MKTLKYLGPQDAVSVAGVGKIRKGQEIAMEDGAAEALLASSRRQRFERVAEAPAVDEAAPARASRRAAK